MPSARSTTKPPSAYQPSKAELEDDARVDATPQALAWAVTRGGADRRTAKERKTVANETGQDDG